jgi:thioredoxin-like negative regulator of GroEL
MDAIKAQGIPVNKLDIDYTADVTTRYNVKSVPTVILVENGQEIRRFTGVRNVEQVINFYNG